MSLIVSALPYDLVREVKGYVFDWETSIAVLLQGQLDKDPTFTIADLFGKLTAVQLYALFMECCRDKFYTKWTNKFTNETYDTFRDSIIPRIKYRWGHAPCSIHHGTSFSEREKLHPISDNVEYFLCPKKFGKQRPKRILAVNDLFHFLRYTEIGDLHFDNFVRKMAYDVLAGTLVILNANKQKKRKHAV